MAAIVHSYAKKAKWEEFYKINTLLPENIAKKAKEQGVKQFIFFSTMAVYGAEKKLPNGSIINQKSQETPTSYYGKSKYIAEKKIDQLKSDTFKVAIVRPPSIHGPNCPGNYISSFIKLANTTPIFPYVYDNCKQSFIYIENLTELIRLIIEKETEGLYMPQDGEPISTVELIKVVSEGKEIYFSEKIGYFVKLFQNNKLVKKIYGGIAYDTALSNYFDGKYQIYGNKESFHKYI